MGTPKEGHLKNSPKTTLGSRRAPQNRSWLKTFSHNPRGFRIANIQQRHHLLQLTCQPEEGHYDETMKNRTRCPSRVANDQNLRVRTHLKRHLDEIAKEGNHENLPKSHRSTTKLTVRSSEQILVKKYSLNTHQGSEDSRSPTCATNDQT